MPTTSTSSLKVWSVEVTGSSMVPTVQVGERVLVRDARPVVGAVVLIKSGEEFLLHRLVARIGIGRWCRWIHLGDASGSAPGICATAQICGIAEIPNRELTFWRKCYYIICWLKPRASGSLR